MNMKRGVPFYTAAMREPLPAGFTPIDDYIAKMNHNIRYRLLMRNARRGLAKYARSPAERIRLLHGDPPPTPWRKRYL